MQQIKKVLIIGKDSDETSFTLNNGERIPKLGLGTYKQTKGEPILMALQEAGYRHIDTAAEYKNEEKIGIAIKKVIESG